MPRWTSTCIICTAALHLYTHEGVTRKLVRGGQRPLVELIREVFDKGGEPLFVAAGRAEQKQQAVRKNAYLSYCFDKLSALRGDVVIFGLSLGESDNHIFQALADNAGLARVYLSIHGDPVSSGNLQMRSIARRLEETSERRRGAEKPGLKVSLFDSDSARVWG